MKKYIEWLHMILCAGWTIYLVGYMIVEPDEALDEELLIVIVPALTLTISGLFLFFSACFEGRSRLSQLKQRNAVLKREIEQAELENKLKEMKTVKSEPKH